MFTYQENMPERIYQGISIAIPRTDGSALRAVVLYNTINAEL